MVLESDVLILCPIYDFIAIFASFILGLLVFDFLLSFLFFGYCYVWRRHAGGRVHAAGQPEPPNDKLLAQEFANLLGRAMTASQRVSTKWTDQEVW